MTCLLADWLCSAFSVWVRLRRVLCELASFGAASPSPGSKSGVTRLPAGGPPNWLRFARLLLAIRSVRSTALKAALGSASCPTSSAFPRGLDLGGTGANWLRLARHGRVRSDAARRFFAKQEAPEDLVFRSVLLPLATSDLKHLSQLGLIRFKRTWGLRPRGIAVRRSRRSQKGEEAVQGRIRHSCHLRSCRRYLRPLPFRASHRSWAE